MKMKKISNKKRWKKRRKWKAGDNLHKKRSRRNTRSRR